MGKVLKQVYIMVSGYICRRFALQQSQLQKCVLSITKLQFIARKEECSNLLQMFLIDVGFYPETYQLFCQKQSVCHLGNNSSSIQDHTLGLLRKGHLSQRGLQKFLGQQQRLLSYLAKKIEYVIKNQLDGWIFKNQINIFSFYISRTS